METKSKTAISLFSGAGGLDIGILQAGFEVLTCIEIDPHCCSTLKTTVQREQRSTRIIEDDIRNVDAKDLMEQLSLRRGELDLLCGGPPCQPFSQIGKKGFLTDKRGLLLFEIIKFAKVFFPKAIMIEQVKGILNAHDETGCPGTVMERLLKDLEELGYQAKWKIMNAADYGVPQLRERVIIVATQKNYQFIFPYPTHAHHTEQMTLFSLKPYVTVGEVLKDLDKPQIGKDTHREDSHVDVTPQGDKKRINGVLEGGCLVNSEHLPPEQKGKLTKKDTTKFKRLARNEPANTLRCGEIFFHPLEDRYLSPREYMRIHGYPDDYILQGPIRGRSGQVKYLDQHRQIANSVPPPLARAVAQSIWEALEGKTELCQEYLKFSVIP
jgi:DNA (cytosine-5)-methyltransferase 1